MRPWIEVTTQVGCKSACRYCPQDKFVSAYSGVKKMTPERLEIYLSNVPRNVDVHFSGFSEVMLHEDAPELLSIACEAGHNVYLYTTLNGLTEDKAARMSIKGVMFEKIIFHEYDGPGFDADDFGRKKTLLFMNVGRKTHDTIRLTRFDLRAGNLRHFAARKPPKKLKGPIRCESDRHYGNVLLPNGKMVLCCCDWSLEHPIGDLSCEGYMSRAVEERRNEILSLQKRTKSNVLCRTCEHARVLLT